MILSELILEAEESSTFANEQFLVNFVLIILNARLV